MIRCYTVPEIWHVTDKCYFSFWANFCPFTPLTAQKIKILKKGKKTLEISSFDICVPKIMIRCMVPEIWYTTDRQTDGWIKWHIEVPHLKISVNIPKFLGYIYKKMVLFYKNILIYNLLIKLNSKNQSFKKKISTAIWRPHGQLWSIIRGGSLIHPMLITVFYIFDPKVTRSLITRFGP